MRLKHRGGQGVWRQFIAAASVLLLLVGSALAYRYTRPVSEDLVYHFCRMATRTATVDLGSTLIEDFVQQGRTATYTLATLPLNRSRKLPATCVVTGFSWDPQVSVDVLGHRAP